MSLSKVWKICPWRKELKFWKPFVSHETSNLFQSDLITYVLLPDHVNQINNDLKQTYVPNPSTVPVYIINSNGQKVSTTLDQLAATANKLADFGDDEITIFITGLPSSSESVQKANQELEDAFMKSFNVKNQKPSSLDYEGQQTVASEEADWDSPRTTSRSLVVSYNPFGRRRCTKTISLNISSISDHWSRR